MRSLHRLALVAAAAALTIVGTLAAALVYQTLVGPARSFDWPWRAAPIAATALAYCVVTSASADLLLPLLARRPIDRAWPQSLLGVVPSYVIGAGIAVGLVEMIDQRAWQGFAAVAFPLAAVDLAYCDHPNHPPAPSRPR